MGLFNRKENLIKKSRELNITDENINSCMEDIDLYLDTTKIHAGFVTWTIETIKTTAKKPWVTYKPVPRVITGVHNNGINRGTIFFSYKPIVVKTPINENLVVENEEDSFYSPLTKSQAFYICKLLNIQSMHTYLTAVKKQK